MRCGSTVTTTCRPVSSRGTPKPRHAWLRNDVPAYRTYRDYVEMADRESARADGVDVVTVARPNDSHFAIASEFLRRGVSVVCEKPLTQESATSAELVEIAATSGAILAVPHSYTAYALVQQAA